MVKMGCESVMDSAKAWLEPLVCWFSTQASFAEKDLASRVESNRLCLSCCRKLRWVLLMDMI